MNWNPYARIRELEAEVVRLRRSLAVVERSHDVLRAENYALADMVRVQEEEVEDWQVRWGEAIRDADDARALVEIYARYRAAQEEADARTLNVVTGEWPG